MSCMKLVLDTAHFFVCDSRRLFTRFYVGYIIYQKAADDKYNSAHCRVFQHLSALSQKKRVGKYGFID